MLLQDSLHRPVNGFALPFSVVCMSVVERLWRFGGFEIWPP